MYSFGCAILHDLAHVGVVASLAEFSTDLHKMRHLHAAGWSSGAGEGRENAGTGKKGPARAVTMASSTLTGVVPRDWAITGRKLHPSATSGLDWDGAQVRRDTRGLLLGGNNAYDTGMHMRTCICGHAYADLLTCMHMRAVVLLAAVLRRQRCSTAAIQERACAQRRNSGCR